MDFLTEYSREINGVLFYEIYSVDETKYIKLILETDRADWGKPYLSFIYRRYCGNCPMELKKFLAFDVYYNKTKIQEDDSSRFVECQPDEILEMLNNFIKKHDNIEKKYLHQLSIETKEGIYYA